MTGTGFLGEVRLAGTWRPAQRTRLAATKAPRRLAQAETDLIQDLTQVVSVPEWAVQTWTKETALVTFNVANLLKSIQAKVAYSAIVFRDIVADPRFTVMLQGTPEGQDFITAANATARWSEQLSKPNLMGSLANLQTALEINVLPRFGVGVTGWRPMFRGSRFDTVRVDTTERGRPETVDFGNLATSSLKSDAEALEVVSRKAESLDRTGPVSLGAIPPLIVFVIKAAIVIGGALLVGRTVLLPSLDKISDMVKPTYLDPKILEIIEGIRATDPQKADEMLNNLLKTRQFWESAVDVAKWVAVGVGTLAVAWILSRVLGLFSGQSGAPVPAQA